MAPTRQQTEINEERMNAGASGPCLGSPGKQLQGVMDTQCRCIAWELEF